MYETTTPPQADQERAEALTPEVMAILISLREEHRPIIPQLDNTIYLMSLAYSKGLEAAKAN